VFNGNKSEYDNCSWKEKKSIVVVLIRFKFEYNHYLLEGNSSKNRRFGKYNLLLLYHRPKTSNKIRLRERVKKYSLLMRSRGMLAQDKIQH
jgi:hypothetical protein